MSSSRLAGQIGRKHEPTQTESASVTAPDPGAFEGGAWAAQPARVHWPVRMAPRWWQWSLPPIGVSVRVEPLTAQE